MTVSSINSTTSASAQTAAASTNALQGTSDEFLKLFMAQLQNQDPIDPQNSTDMVAQLAQFSSVEQQTQTNTQLSQLTAMQQSSANSNLASLVGRQCNASLGPITVTDPTNIPPIETSSSGPISGASITVTDSSGKTVRSIPIPAGGGPVQWDGKDSSGKLLPPGSYTLAVNTGTTSTAIDASFQGRVDSIQLGTSASMLQMEGIEVSPGEITTIGATVGTPTGTTSTAGTPITTTTTNDSTTTQGAKV